MKRIVALAFLLFTLVAVKTEAAIIVVFGQSTGTNLFTGNETAGVTVLDANGIPVTITTLDENGVSLAAFFSLDATSTALAVNQGGNIYTQAYSGSFSILSAGGFNYLSGTFDGVQLGIDGGTTLIFGATQPPLQLDFTSDVVGMPLDDPTAMALALTNVFPGVTISNGSFGDFTSSVAGNFSATELTAVPEPASLFLLGSGLCAIAARGKKYLRKA
jgi:PEP-CTERM motif